MRKINYYPENAIIVDGFDDCIIGIAERCSQPDIVAYDTDKIIEKLVADGMLRDEAEEHFYFNIQGAWLGEDTPVFIRKLTK